MHLVGARKRKGPQEQEQTVVIEEFMGGMIGGVKVINCLSLFGPSSLGADQKGDTDAYVTTFSHSSYLTNKKNVIWDYLHSITKAFISLIYRVKIINHLYTILMSLMLSNPAVFTLFTIPISFHPTGLGFLCDTLFLNHRDLLEQK